MVYIACYSYVSGVGDCSSDGSLVGTGVVGEGVGREMEEEVEKEGGEKDSVLLFDEKTDSFQLYKENEGKVAGHNFTCSLVSTK